MVQCWRFSGKGHDGSNYEYFACGTTPEFRFNEQGDCLLYLDGTNLGGIYYHYVSGTQSVSSVTGYNSTSGFYTSGDCNNCKTITYDCINGECVDSTTYKTLGLYKSLVDCQAVCANGGACADGKQCVDPTTFCPNGKVCIDQDEYNTIEGLISKINSEVC